MIAPHAPDKTLASMTASLGPILTWVKHALRDAADHSGVPILIVAAMAIVLSLRLARRLVRVVIEVAFVAVMLLVATKYGWIRW